MVQRDKALDLVRAAAAFCVVVNHAAQMIYPLNLEGLYALPLRSKGFALAAFTFGRIGVPLFLLLTGYLLLPRQYDEERMRHFYRHNFFPLLGVWEIWIFVYQLFLCLVNRSAFDGVQYIKRALFLAHAGLPHTWYMPMILGMYLFLPFVSIALHRIPEKMLTLFLPVCFFYVFMMPAANLIQSAFHIPDYIRLTNQLDLSFSGSTYGFYLVLGYCLAKKRELIKRLRGNSTAVLAVAVLALSLYLGTVYAELKLYAMGFEFNVWYSFVTMPLLGVCVFILLSWIHLPAKLSCIAEHLASCAFGIFLVHELLLMPAVRTLGSVPHPYLETIVLSVLCYGASFILVKNLSRIPVFAFLFLKKS